MADEKKPIRQYGLSASILNPKREDNILRLLDPKREDNLFRRVVDAKRPDNILHSLFGTDPNGRNMTRPAPPGPSRITTVPGRPGTDPGTFDRIFGPRPRNLGPGAQPGIGGRGPGPEEALPEFAFGGAPSLADFLAQAKGMYSGAFSGIDNRKADLERRREEALAAIGGSTEALAGALGQSRDQLDQRYNEQLSSAAEASQANRQALVEGQQSLNQGSNEILEGLGIADGVDRSDLTRQQQGGQTSLAEMAGAADTRMRADQMNAYELGTRGTDVARKRGVEIQGGYERDAQSALARLLDERASMERESAQAGYGMYSDARNAWQNDRNFAYQDWLRQQGWAREDAQGALDFDRQMTMQQMEAANQPPELNDFQGLMSELQGYGVTGPKANEWINRLYGNIPKIQSDPNGFNQLFNQASPQAKAALYNYLLSTGVIGKA